MALNGIPIDENECIGDSLEAINNSFVTLDQRTLSLSADLPLLSSASYTTIQNVSGDVYTTIQNVSGNNYTTIQNVSGDLYSIIGSVSGIVTDVFSLTALQLSGVTFTNDTTFVNTFTADGSVLKVAVGNYYKYVKLNDVNGVINMPTSATPMPTPTPTITPTVTPTVTP